MSKFEVNVRAIVTATRGTGAGDPIAEGWDEYDFEALERDDDGQTVVASIRCDQFVTVEADDEASAIEAAKNDASAIVMDGWIIDDVKIWVDDGIDVTPVVEPAAPAGPKF